MNLDDEYEELPEDIDEIRINLARLLTIIFLVLVIVIAISAYFKE